MELIRQNIDDRGSMLSISSDTNDSVVKFGNLICETYFRNPSFSRTLDIKEYILIALLMFSNYCKC